MSTPNQNVALIDAQVLPQTHTENIHNRLAKFFLYRWFFAILFMLGGLIGFRTRSMIIIVPYLWLLLFFFCPFLIVLKISLSEPTIAQPPYLPMLEDLGEGAYNLKISFYNYIVILTDDYYYGAFFKSLKIASISTFFTLLVGFPMAYAMAKSPKHIRNILLMLVILPFWSSFLIRTYALIGILKDKGLLNNFLMDIGVNDLVLKINELLMGMGLMTEPFQPPIPLHILNTDTAVYIGIVYSYLPFMVLPIYAALEKMDWTLMEAAADLGANKFKAFWKIVVPLSKTGVLAGCFLVFIPAIGEFVIPDLLGGADTIMIGKVLWMEFFNNLDWTMASAVAVCLLLVLVGPIVFYQRIQEKSL